MRQIFLRACESLDNVFEGSEEGRMLRGSSTRATIGVLVVAAVAWVGGGPAVAAAPTGQGGSLASTRSAEAGVAVGVAEELRGAGPVVWSKAAVQPIQATVGGVTEEIGTLLQLTGADAGGVVRASVTHYRSGAGTVDVLSGPDAAGAVQRDSWDVTWDPSGAIHDAVAHRSSSAATREVPMKVQTANRAKSVKHVVTCTVASFDPVRYLDPVFGYLVQTYGANLCSATIDYIEIVPDVQKQLSGQMTTMSNTVAYSYSNSDWVGGYGYWPCNAAGTGTWRGTARGAGWLVGHVSMGLPAIDYSSSVSLNCG